MHAAHEFLLVGGGLGLLAIATGLFAVRFGTPLLLVFLALGMLAGEDGPGGIRFDDFGATYLAGSIALVAILAEAGLKTSLSTIRAVVWPALMLASVGVILTALIVGAAAVLIVGVSWPAGLLLGALLAPTDAAAVSSVLRASRVAVPERVTSVLEVESGINDPVSVFLTVLLVEVNVAPQTATFTRGVELLAGEMGGGLLLGAACGWLLQLAIKRLQVETNLHPVLLLAGALALFGGAQMLHASGFLAVFVAAVVVGEQAGERARALERTFEGFAWIAQIGLLVVLGLLVTPHDMFPLALPSLALTAVLVFIARPAATLLCLRPFGFSWAETAFVGWVGLRGAVPIYLAIIPVLDHVPEASLGFAAAFGIVIASLALQGWTAAPAARLLRLDRPGAQ